VLRGRANSGIRGSARGGFAKPIKRADDVITPKPNLSFNDNRSVNALQFGRSVTDKNTSISDRGCGEPQTAPKVFKPNNYNQGFALASPEDFLAQSWAGKSGNNAFSDDKEGKQALNGSLDQARKPKATANNTSGTDARNIPPSVAPSATSTNFQRPCERPTVGSLVASSNDIAHSALVQVGNEFGGKVLMIGSGIVRIKTVDYNSQIPKTIQIEVSGKILLEEPLLESLEFKLDSCTISFYSGFEGHGTKWILTASQPEIATNLVEALEHLKPQSIYISSADAAAKGHASEMATVEEVESLISFSDEDPTPPQAVSQFTGDLFSLMGNQFIEDAVNAINVKIEQNSTTAAASEVPGTCEAEDTQKQQKTLRGLATSRFANNVEVGDFFSRSAVFQKLPDSTAAYIKEQVSKRVFEEARKDTFDQEVFKPFKQQPRKQYSVEKLMSLRNQPSFSKKPSVLDPCVESSSRDEPRPLFSFPELARVASESPSLLTSEIATYKTSRMTRFGVPIVSGRETARKLPGLATSKYASPQTEEMFREPSKSKEPESPAPKPFQGLSHPAKPDALAPKPIQGLSTSKYASPTAETLFRGSLNTRTPEPPAAKPMQGLASSNNRPNHAVKSFQSFLNLQDYKPPGPKLFQGLPTPKFPDPPAAKMYQELATSKFPDTPLAQPFRELPASSHSKPAPSEPLQGLSTPNHVEHSVIKPFQGLASSKYASPLAARSVALKTSVSTTAQSGPKNPAVVVKTSTSKATIAGTPHESMTQTSTAGNAATATPDDAVHPSIFSTIMNSMQGKEKDNKVLGPKILTGTEGIDEPPSPILGSWNTLRRRDSYNSHASKDSNETVKPPMSKPIIKPVQDHTVPVRSSKAASGHQSILSMDSSASCESFATAIEETSTEGEAGGEDDAMTAPGEVFRALKAGKRLIGSQAPMSDFVLFPADMTRPEASRTGLPMKSTYSSDMSELMGDFFVGTARPDALERTSPSLCRTLNTLHYPTSPPRKLVAGDQGGLKSLKFATAAEDIAPGVIKPQPQPSSVPVSNQVKSGLNTPKLASKPPISETEPSTRPRVLKPTASQFTPSISRSLTTPTQTASPPVMNTFSAQMQPVMATVLVQDPQWPGILREVSGLLKMGSTPIVGFVAAENSPMGESFASGHTSANGVSPQKVMVSVRPALSPIRQESNNNIKDKQQKIQGRLTKSLAQRRLSESPSSGGF
jgi:hypothetical protein